MVAHGFRTYCDLIVFGHLNRFAVDSYILYTVALRSAAQIFKTKAYGNTQYELRS